MRVVHISDFHITQNSLEDLRNFIVNPLIADLNKFDGEKKIDLILFTGDLVDKGGQGFSGDIELAFYTFQEEVIEPIMESLGLSSHQFLFIPGNHDIVRGDDSKISEGGMKATLTSIDEVNHFIDSNETDGIKRVLPFKKFEKEFFNDFKGRYQLSNYNSNFIFDIDNTLIGVSCFNSSWRCYESQTDKGNIILGERQVTRSREFLRDCDIKIGLIHHPLDEFVNFETKQIESMLIRDYDLLLLGHVHEASNWSMTNMNGTTLISIAPSNWTSNVRTNLTNFKNGYSIIDYVKEEKVTIIHRRYSHYKEAFIADVELGNHGETGTSVYIAPSQNEKIQQNEESTIIDKIREVHLSEIDRHLISYETDTVAPKKIEELFVLPRIVQKEEGKVSEEGSVVKEKSFTLEDICNQKDNLLLVGAKEAGKTILMDRILLELVEHYSKYRRIPIYINFDETESNKIETLISRYLNIGIHEIKENTLKKFSFVLLIDNMKFEKKYTSLLRNLQDFALENPSVKIIATCTSNTDGEIPLEALENSILEIFKPAFIKGFNTKEIKQLMVRWFSGKKRVLDQDHELDRLIKTLSTLNISRTPLAISMFLWIIEKQENYSPVNNSQMLENFLERLLSKTSVNEVYSSEFNYKNKDRLLSEIALKMHQEDQLNYRLLYQDLRTFIHNNFKLKKYDFDEEKILRYFVSKGIFTVEKEGSDRYVKFKFACFFQFYLMKNIDKNSDFKKFVLAEENFLHFVDELDYYSGLHIDDAELLKLSVDRMYEEYSSYIFKLENTNYSYDTNFETLHTIVDYIETSDIQNFTSNEYKQTDEDLEREHDLKLSNQHDTQIIKKGSEIHPFTKLERHWVLAAKILKNTEEITVENLKTEAFTKILKCSLVFVTMYKYILKKYLADKDPAEMSHEQFHLILKFLPVVHQVVLYQTAGTGKLSIVLEENIEQILDDSNISDFEKFVCVFMYADLKGRHKNKYINKLIRNIKRYYIKDMVFIKLMEYLYRKDTTKKEEDIYKNQLGDLVTKDDGKTIEARRMHKKGEFIAKLDRAKKEFSQANSRN